ncbi:MAG TPA: YHS domain-containing protein [Chloroflexota bacterium]|nr:YHS domain-containing protein [Chloroflexota bacterium]
MALVKDPVCGMSVNTLTARHKAEHEGRTYCFCAPGCRKAFEEDPRKFLDPNYQPSM